MGSWKDDGCCPGELLSLMLYQNSETSSSGKSAVQVEFNCFKNFRCWYSKNIWLKAERIRLTNTERLGPKCSYESAWKRMYILGTHECNFFYLKTFVVAKVGSNLWTKCTAGKAAGRGSLTVSTSAPASKSAAKCRTSPTSAATRSRSERVGRLRPNLSQATWSNQSNQSNANCEVQCFNTFWYRWYASIFQLSSK